MMKMDKVEKTIITLTLLALVFVAGMLIFALTTENAIVKMFGGTQEITLDAGQKLVTMTWKKNDLWLQTRDMRPEEYAETHRFSEQSSLGILEGTIIIHEVAPVKISE